jgi:hypothetical protein
MPVSRTVPAAAGTMCKENYSRCISRNVQFTAEGYFTRRDFNFSGTVFPRCYLTHDLRPLLLTRTISTRSKTQVPCHPFSINARRLWHYRGIIGALCIDWFRCLLRFQTGTQIPLWQALALWE